MFNTVIHLITLSTYPQSLSVYVHNTHMCIVSKPTINRQQQGQILAKIDGSVKRINDSSYIVNSQSSNGLCHIRLTELGRNCSCPDHLYRDVKCKHIYAVEFTSALREQVKKEIVIQPVDSLSCRYCSSGDIVRKAIRRNNTVISRDICVRTVLDDSL
jgi:hypothetical protein